MRHLCCALFLGRRRVESRAAIELEQVLPNSVVLIGLVAELERHDLLDLIAFSLELGMDGEFRVPATMLNTPDKRSTRHRR